MNIHELQTPNPKILKARVLDAFHCAANGLLDTINVEWEAPEKQGNDFRKNKFYWESCFRWGLSFKSWNPIMIRTTEPEMTQENLNKRACS